MKLEMRTLKNIAAAAMTLAVVFGAASLKPVTANAAEASVSASIEEENSYISFQDEAYQNEFLRRVNNERAKAGLKPVQLGDSSHNSAAQERAKELASSYSYVRPNGQRDFTIFAENGIDDASVGENYIAGVSTPDAAVDQLSSATPLAVADKSKLSLLDLFMGIHGGVLGETCALAIVLGLIYLVATKTISIAIPASYVGSVFVFYLIATKDLHSALVAVLSGGLLFGAVFMATDYVTSPFTLKGKLVYGVALGIVTFAIRYWGSYTEGVSFALLFMNLWVPYINDLTRQTPYGYVKPAKKAKEGADK